MIEVMRPHLAAMWEDRDRLVQQVARAVTDQVPSYAATPSSEIWIGMTRILERVALGDPFSEPTEEDQAAAHGTGAQGAGAGITPPDLVAAVLLGAGVVESDVMRRAEAAGVDAETRLAASTLARRWAEQVAVWATRSLVAAQRADVARDVAEEAFIQDLRAGLRDAEVIRRGEGLGLDAHRGWFAVHVLGSPDIDPATRTSLRLSVGGALWTSVAEGPIGAEMAGLTPRIPPVRGDLVIGVAGPASLLEGATLLVDAARAARTARRFGRPGCHDLTSLGLLVPLHEDPDLGERLVERWLTPLLEPARHQLVATIRGWLAHDGQVELVAREFGVHANTVRNRLGRITTALGAEWRDPANRSAIWAALQVSTAQIVNIST